MDDMDARYDERFDLLSAYLDGEVTPAERRQVEAWIATDPEFQKLHTQMLKLQRSFQALPAPAATSAEETTRKVFARLDRRPRLLVWSSLGAAAAASVIGLVSGAITGGGPMLMPQTTASIPASPQAREVQVPQPAAPTVAINPVNGNMSASEASGIQSLAGDQGLLLALDRPPIDIP
jgi:anti-sigma factor RsiW